MRAPALQTGSGTGRAWAKAEAGALRARAVRFSLGSSPKKSVVFLASPFSIWKNSYLPQGMTFSLIPKRPFSTREMFRALLSSAISSNLAPIAA